MIVTAMAIVYWYFGAMEGIRTAETWTDILFAPVWPIRASIALSRWTHDTFLERRERQHQTAHAVITK